MYNVLGIFKRRQLRNDRKSNFTQDHVVANLDDTQAGLDEPDFDHVAERLSALERDSNQAMEFQSHLMDEAAHVIALTTLFPNEQIYRRVVVRSLLSICEGLIWQTKQTILVCSSPVFLKQGRQVQVAGFSLQETERDLLNDEEKQLESKGTVETKRARINWEANIRFTFGLIARGLGDKEFRPNYGDSGWQSYRRAVLVRDRITHPKGISSLKVSEDDLQAAVEGFKWLSNTCFVGVKALYNNQHQGIRRHHHKAKEYRDWQETEVVRLRDEAAQDSARIKVLETEQETLEAKLKELEAERAGYEELLRYRLEKDIKQ